MYNKLYMYNKPVGCTCTLYNKHRVYVYNKLRVYVYNKPLECTYVQQTFRMYMYNKLIVYVYNKP